MRTPAVATAPVPIDAFGLPALLAEAFPFHLAVDDAGRVVAAGPALRRACPALLIGTAVADHVQVQSPAGVRLRPAEVADYRQSLFLLTARGGALTLRGQVLMVHDDHGSTEEERVPRPRPASSGAVAVFLGSPWVTSPEELAPLGLTFADFAVHDPAVDFLMLLQAQKAALADAERLAERLAEAAAARTRLAAAERKLAAELDAIPDLVLRLDRQARLLEVRPARDGQLPAPAPELLGTDATTLFPGWATRLPRTLHRALRSRATQALAFTQPSEQQTIHYEARLTVSGSDEVLVLVRDVTERRQLEEQLRRQAFSDPLTGLANRALLHDRIAQALRSRRGPTSEGPHLDPVLLLVDLDDFKTVNDTLGHPAGDRLLTVVADRLRGHARAGDTVARLGGDEFALLLTGGGVEIGAAVAQRLLASLSHPVDVGGRTVHPRASVGVAVADGGLDADGLLRNADLAMYAAKNAGKHRWAAFHPDLHRDMLTRLALETDLRVALGATGADRSGSATQWRPDAGTSAAEQLDVHYQPVVDLATGRIVAVEALLRWTHPVHGPVPPDTFIPLAEEAGLVVDLGRWVLRRACAQAGAWNRRWPDGPPLTVSVNLSPRQLEAPDLCADVRAALRDGGLPATCLVLEVTESALLDQAETAVGTLTALHDLGVRLAIDDFGTGHSSLSRLRALPVDILKIDRALIAEVGTTDSDSAVARAIIDLARALRLSVVAEGIEHAPQLHGLQALSCDYGQGFHLGRPAPAAVIEAQLADAFPGHTPAGQR